MRIATRSSPISPRILKTEILRINVKQSKLSLVWSMHFETFIGVGIACDDIKTHKHASMSEITWIAHEYRATEVDGFFNRLLRLQQRMVRRSTFWHGVVVTTMVLPIYTTSALSFIRIYRDSSRAIFVSYAFLKWKENCMQKFLTCWLLHWKPAIPFAEKLFAVNWCSFDAFWWDNITSVGIIHSSLGNGVLSLVFGDWWSK